MRNIKFLYTHPIQYFTPLHKEIQSSNFCKSKVLYCENTIDGYYDKEFQQNIRWDIPLIEGYDSVFLNRNKISSNNGFFKHINLDLYKHIKKSNTDILIIHGWNYFTAVYAIILCKFLGIKIWIRGENPYCQEIVKSKINKFLKNIIFKLLVFKLIDKFIYIGKENKLFFEYYGVKYNKLIFLPYCVDNSRFSTISDSLQKDLCKQKIGFNLDRFIILFSGKLINKKNPKDLIDAFNISNLSNFADLVLLGEGNLSENLKDYVKYNCIKNVHFIGFKNQTELPLYYKSADLFVLPSGNGETWGLVVNEAMNFSLPIIVSDRVGCACDLIENTINGFVFKLGDINQLAQILSMVYNNKNWLLTAGDKSKNIIKNYSYDVVLNNLKIAIES